MVVRIRFYLDELNYPLKCIFIAVHCYLHSFIAIHVFDHVGKVRYIIIFLNPMSVEEHFLPILVRVPSSYEYLYVIEIKRLARFLGLGRTGIRRKLRHLSTSDDWSLIHGRTWRTVLFFLYQLVEQ